MAESWTQHYHHFDLQKTPAAATLRKALELFEQQPLAAKQSVDLGCGSGIDTFAMLSAGWQVLAIDQEPEALRKVTEATPPPFQEALKTQSQSFETLSALPTCGLVNASFSLPFCRPQHFPALWQRITGAIVTGGRFAGHLFGVHDEWSTREEMTFFTTEEAQALFSGFELEALKEVDGPGKTAAGATKHWHVFHIVARKQR